MTLIVDNRQRQVVIEGVAVPLDTSSLPANVATVTVWDFGQTRVIFNDGTPRALIADPSPYASFLNAWIAAKVGLTVAQAKQVKSEFLEAIFNAKRQLPVTAAGHSWPASDGEHAAMAANVAAAATTAHAGISLSFSFSFDPGRLTVVDGGAVVDPGQLSSASSSASLTVPPITAALYPVGASSPVTLNAADLSTVLAAISAQKAATLQTRNAKQATIAGLSSVGAVASYDITVGW